jgi:hypothetical protein
MKLTPQELADRLSYTSKPKIRKFEFGGSIEGEDNNIASTTYVKPAPIAKIYRSSERDTGSISIGDSSKKMRDTQETPDEYWSYRSRIKRNIERMGENIGKVGDKLIKPAVALTAMSIGGLPGSLVGSSFFGDKMSDLDEPTAEGISAIVGQVKNPLSEASKRIGGFSDLKTSYNEFKKGEFENGFLNLATGIGGVYDSNWIPGRYDDVVDKGLELLNLYGDTKDVYKSVESKLKNKSK